MSHSVSANKFMTVTITTTYFQFRYSKTDQSLSQLRDLNLVLSCKIQGCSEGFSVVGSTIPIPQTSQGYLTKVRVEIEYCEQYATVTCGLIF